MNMLINQLETINIPLECKSPVDIVIGKAFCRSDNLQNCVNQLLDVAIKAQSKSLAISIHLLGDEHTLTGYHYDRLAFLLHNRKNYERSIIFRNKAITVRKAILDGYHPDIAWSLYGLGNSLEQLGRLNEALGAYQQSLETRRSYLGNHYLTANSYFKVGQIYQKLKQLDEALVAHSATVEIRKVINDHPQSIARALCAYGDLLVSSNDKGLLRKAETAYQEEHTYRLKIPYDDAKTPLDLHENERTGQGSHGWGHQDLDIVDLERGEKRYICIRMQHSSQGKIISQCFSNLEHGINGVLDELSDDSKRCDNTYPKTQLCTHPKAVTNEIKGNTLKITPKRVKRKSIKR